MDVFLFCKQRNSQLGKFFLCAFFLLGLSVRLTAQTVDVIRGGAGSNVIPGKSFQFIEPATTPPSTTFIGSIRAAGLDEEVNLSKLFFKIRSKAKQLGANSFKLSKFESSENPRKKVLILDVYFVGDSLLTTYRKKQINGSAVFFLDDQNSEEVYVFLVNDIPRKVKSGSYYQFFPIPGQDFRVAESGIFGTPWVFKWKEDMPDLFFTFTDFGLESKEHEYDYLGKYFNATRLNFVDSDLGYMLLVLLE